MEHGARGIEQEIIVQKSEVRGQTTIHRGQKSD